jgi:hypothetical protein
MPSFLEMNNVFLWIPYVCCLSFLHSCSINLFSISNSMLFESIPWHIRWEWATCSHNQKSKFLNACNFVDTELPTKSFPFPVTQQYFLVYNRLPLFSTSHHCHHPLFHPTHPINTPLLNSSSSCYHLKPSPTTILPTQLSDLIWGMTMCLYQRNSMVLSGDSFDSSEIEGLEGSIDWCICQAWAGLALVWWEWKLNSFSNCMFVREEKEVGG